RFDAADLAAVEDAQIAIFERGSDETRSQTVRVLSLIAGPRVDLVLIEAARDFSAEVRLQAVRALGRRRLGDAVTTLGECLADVSEDSAPAAADALGAIGGQDAIDLLVAAMPAAGARQRESICATLARLGFDALYPLLDVLIAA